ncbi:hypothetical protein I6I07_20585 [Achromobacter deleyi]|uniref:Uncharacterized protein n=1 Tax=Achromobacter deleyi TaxID=1353891 RepID=A0A7T4E199_9BURK|nr:hypothetical protein [Achromobacter deleyi]QQB33037.1 hypothetical protein I6I07_20585 [Achromobacter deleyi]
MRLARAVETIAEYETSFQQQNGGRDLRSLSVHPNGQDWLFLECLDHEDSCFVMRYNLGSEMLFRFVLPEGYSYSYAHYSPRGTYIVMSRNPIYGETYADAQRGVSVSQILMIRSDGKDLRIVPVSTGVNLSPIMSQDERKVAFWRSDRVLPAGQVSLLDLNIWEYDLASKSERLFTGKKFDFLSGRELFYRNSAEIFLGSYGPSSRLSNPSYGKKFSGNEIFTLERGQLEDPVPVQYPGVINAGFRTADERGNVFLWAGTIQDPSQGLTRVSPDQRQTIWRTRTGIYPKELAVDPAGLYVAAIFWDIPMRRGKKRTGFAKFSLETKSWESVRVPPVEQATLIHVSAP